ncbi:MAG: BBP7 family outer membrane beta-barrel protein, partial [Pirellulales bacterium]|nr:BBP7 family outer membrane beta-barrel protein [Pirellulales bacterium]
NLNDVAPDASFAWGERYEFGVFSGDNSWVVSILDGPEFQSSGSYGFGLTGQDETLGLYPGYNPFFNQLASPLGSVLIPFYDPQNLMLGYLDVRDGLVNEGPPGDVLEDDSNGDGILDGDGIADDIDRDGHFGPDGIDTEDPGEVPDRLGGGLPHDLGDLVFLPTSWQFVNVRNTTESVGVELMKYYRLKNDHFMAKHQNNEITLSAGVRYLQLNDQFIVNAEGGVMGLSFWDTQVVNHLVGPQIGINWHHQRRRVGFDLNGRCLLAYNVQNFDQTAALGEDLITGQHNHPLYFPPSYSTHGKQENFFSPTAEMRVQGSYQVTQAIALKLGYTAIFVDNISRAAAQVRYELPQMGFNDGTAGKQEIFINGVDFGVEAVF